MGVTDGLDMARGITIQNVHQPLDDHEAMQDTDIATILWDNFIEIEDDSTEEAEGEGGNGQETRPGEPHLFQTTQNTKKSESQGGVRWETLLGRGSPKALPARVVASSHVQMTATKSAPSKPTRPLLDPAIPGIAYQKRSATNLQPAMLPRPKFARTSNFGSDNNSTVPKILMPPSSKARPSPVEKNLSTKFNTPKTKPDEPSVSMDGQVRLYDLQHVVVDFVNVGVTYAEKVLGHVGKNGTWPFDWKGVRECVRNLKV